MAAGFQFRIDQMPINLDLKSSSGGFYQLDIRDKIWILLIKSGFQTESSRMVVSRYTKFNGYLIHKKKSPLESVSKKYNTRQSEGFLGQLIIFSIKEIPVLQSE